MFLRNSSLVQEMGGHATAGNGISCISSSFIQNGFF